MLHEAIQPLRPYGSSAVDSIKLVGNALDVREEAEPPELFDFAADIFLWTGCRFRYENLLRVPGEDFFCRFPAIQSHALP